MGLDRKGGIMKMKKTKKKRVEEEVEEDKDSEDWCFWCYDGGDLMICDHKGCLKVYHPGCVGKKKSSMYSGRLWTCSRHSCSMCSGTSRFYCFCCPHALCIDCIGASRLALLRGKNGLCKSCVKNILLTEEKSECDLEGEKIDLEDQDEWLFKEYWEIIKEKEGLTLGDVYSADAELKKRENQSCRFKPVTIGDSDESKDLTTSVSDTGVTEFQKPMGKRKGSKPREFIGWGSQPLIQFLRSIGKDTTEKLSQFDVESIIFDYIKDKELYHPKQKKKVQCDDMLYSIFKKRSINRVKIYSLLDEHFSENLIATEDSGSKDEEEIKLEDNNEGTTQEHKKIRVSSDTTITSDEKKASPRFQKSCYASIVRENIKLVYIKRSLLEELLKEPNYSESKVLGSFVRVKNDPQDYLQRNTHQLSQVKGIKEISETNGEGNKIVLQVSYFAKDIPLSLISDSNFSEEECEDLRQNVANGLLKKPTVVEVGQKARELHEDITKHWIDRELVRLQNLVDRANEKGWRREVCEYLDQRELLKQPSEQERLLKQLPEVIAEVIELGSGSGSSDSLLIDNKA